MREREEETNCGCVLDVEVGGCAVRKDGSGEGPSTSYSCGPTVTERCK